MSKLVTGGTGFIGACLVDQLLERGEDVVVLDRAPTTRWDKAAKKPKIILGDITNWPEVMNAVRSDKFDCVYHLAAMLSLPSEANPWAAFLAALSSEWWGLCRGRRRPHRARGVGGQRQAPMNPVPPVTSLDMLQHLLSSKSRLLAALPRRRTVCRSEALCDCRKRMQDGSRHYRTSGWSRERGRPAKDGDTPARCRATPRRAPVAPRSVHLKPQLTTGRYTCLSATSTKMAALMTTMPAMAAAMTAVSGVVVSNTRFSRMPASARQRPRRSRRRLS